MEMRRGLRPMSLTLLWCLLAVGLAGCTSTTDEQIPASRPDGATIVDPRGTGSIEGDVLDTSYLPLENVSVTLEGSGAAGEAITNTTTASDGSFSFSGIPAGVYRVRAMQPGFGQGAALATVTADETIAVRIILDDAPSKTPYLEVLQRTGIFRCAFALVVMPTRCDEALEAAGQGEATGYRGNFTIQAGHMATVLETNWDSQNTILDVWSSYIDDDGSWNYFEEVRGPPVLRRELHPGQDFKGAYASLQDPDFYGTVPSSDQGFQLNTETTYMGQYQEETDAFLNPVCVHTWGNCTGAGAALDFRFDQFSSTFYHSAPADVSTYSAVPKDG